MGTYLTKGETFATGNTVTAAKLNNLVDNATVTAGSIGSTELANAAVTADKISTASPQPVTTGTIRNNAVDNTKLEDMGSQTVKVRSTNSTGDPSNLPMIGGGSDGSSKLLVGTSDSINAVVADEFKLVNSSDANVTNNTAAKLRLHTTAITGQTDLTSGSLDMDNDRLLIFDESPAGLAKVSPKKLIQSLPALTTTSGVVRLATNERAINPSTAGTVDADVLTVNESSPMLAKAFGYIKTSGGSIAAGSVLQNCTVSRTGPGAFTVSFTVNMPTATNYIVLGNGRSGLSAANYGAGLQLVSSSLAAGSFNFVVIDTNGSTGTATDPDGGMQFIVFGLSS